MFVVFDIMDIRIEGKFIFVGDNKFLVKGVSFRDGVEFNAAAIDQLTRLNINTVFIESPTIETLDALSQCHIKVVVLLSIEKYFGEIFSGEKTSTKEWFAFLERSIEKYKTHQAILAYDIGGPISKSIILSMTPQKIRKIVYKSAKKIKSIDNSHLVSFSSFSQNPLKDFGFLDYFTYLMEEKELSDYRAALLRLHDLSQDRAIVIRAESLDSFIVGERKQAFYVNHQIRMGFLSGSAGLCLDGWKDRNNENCGIVTAFSKEKSSFRSASIAFKESPFPPYIMYPRISVVVCAYNVEGYIEECLNGIRKIDYPHFEVIVINDGSRDATSNIISKYSCLENFKIINLENNVGLSVARNIGLESSTGEIIAYIDADAYPDKHWLRYLALTFLSTKHAVIGGPNIRPLASKPMEDCIDKSPGNPKVVMSEDELADHIPGCNLAGRVSFIKALGGFDAHYRGGGDDVNFCWKVLKAGGTLGFSPGAMVWHHRRDSVMGFFKQQIGYGLGEARLEKDWPERFNFLGHQVKRRQGMMNSTKKDFKPPLFSGHIYQTIPSNCGSVFQWVYSLLSMPENIVCWIFFGLLSLFSGTHTLLLFYMVSTCVFLLLPISIYKLIVQKVFSGLSLKYRFVVFALHVTQPIVRLYGRWKGGLTPFRLRCPKQSNVVKSHICSYDNTFGLPPKEIIKRFQSLLLVNKLYVTTPKNEEDFSLKIESGMEGGVKCLVNVTQKEVTFRIRPYINKSAIFIALVLSLTVCCGILDKSYTSIFVSFSLLCLLIFRFLFQVKTATNAVKKISDSCFFAESLWKRFQPPRYFFEKFPIP